MSSSECLVLAENRKVGRSEQEKLPFNKQLEYFLC